MPARLFLSSGDMIADRRFEFARDLQLKGDLAAAADLLLQATELAPDFASAWFTLGEIREQLGEHDAAIAAFRKARRADPDDRHGASLRLMRLGAEQLADMPQAYVQALFDQYAPRFEAALVDDLGYRGPSLLFKAVLSVRAAARKPAFFKRAIDLGCGTGLAATAFAKEVDRLHRHRSVAAHDRAGARDRPLCGAGGRRHGGGLARQAGCQRRSDPRRGRDGLCLRSRAGAARGDAGADAGRACSPSRSRPMAAKASSIGEGLRYAHSAALCARAIAAAGLKLSQLRGSVGAQ